MAISFESDSGKVILDGKLQGRILTELGGETIHRFDRELAAHPSPDEFNNIGGNSLWPAPEGGAFAFNYLDKDWLVQPGVNTAISAERIRPDGALYCERQVPLANRRGAQLEVAFRRRVVPLPLNDVLRKFGVSGVGYREEDELSFSEPQDPERAIVGAWSLEQFPKTPRTVAFGRTGVGGARAAVNPDYYADPFPVMVFSGREFAFRLGGQERIQIGLSASAKCEFIGAFVPERELLIVRRAPFQPEGKYFDIADNEQPRGVWSASDQYSIFNGADMGFFELETIAPAKFRDGMVTGSRLVAETMIFRGPKEKLYMLLEERFDFRQLQNLEE